jgi:hypothetical protein
MVDVGHDPPTCTVDGAHHPLESREQRIVVDPQLGGKLTPVALDVQRLGGQQTHARFGPANVERDMSVGYFTGLRRVTQLDRRHHDAIR